MASHRYLHLDVFAERALEGNQLAVFVDAEGIDLGSMQAIARELAFSETTFILPREDPSTDVRMRIFTPYRELPMAGHPTVGSTFALVEAGTIRADQTRFVFGLGVGPTLVDLEWEGIRLAFAWMHQIRPTFGPAIDDVRHLAEGLGLPESEIRRTGLPVMQVSCGVPYVLVPLAGRATVDSATPSPPALQAFMRQVGADDAGFYLFSTEEAGDDATAYSRMFAEAGIVEDPATGSAAGPLGCYLVQNQVVAPSSASRMVDVQGVRMGRPSRINIGIDVDGGNITDVRVGGKALIVGAGTLEL